MAKNRIQTPIKSTFTAFGNLICHKTDCLTAAGAKWKSFRCLMQQPFVVSLTFSFTRFLLAFICGFRFLFIALREIFKNDWIVKEVMKGVGEWCNKSLSIKIEILSWRNLFKNVFNFFWCDRTYEFPSITSKFYLVERNRGLWGIKIIIKLLESEDNQFNFLEDTIIEIFYSLFSKSNGFGFLHYF